MYCIISFHNNNGASLRQTWSRESYCMRVKLQNCRLNRVLEAAAFRVANLQSFGLRVLCGVYIYAWMYV